MRVSIDLFRSLKKRTLACGYVYAALLVCSQLVGARVYKTHSIALSGVSLFEVAGVAVIALALIAVIGALVALALDWVARNGRRSTKPPWRFLSWRYCWLIIWAFLFVAWLPCLLALWPGSFSYDVKLQVSQVFSGSYSKHHPPLHTFLLALCFKLSDLMGGALEPITVYAFLQMLFLSFCFARAAKLLVDLRAPDAFTTVSVLFFALNPVIALFSINPTKDVIFAGFFVLLLVCIVKAVDSPKRYFERYRNVVAFVVVAVGCCLFRNNFVYALVLFVPFCLWFQDCRMRAGAAVVISVVLGLVISGPLYSAFGIAGSSIKEALSVPIQQIGYVAYTHGDNLPDEEIELIDSVVDHNKIKRKFNYRFADPVKSMVPSSMNGTAFVKAWAKLGVSHPVDYCSEFLDLNIPYWYLGSSSVDPVSNRRFIESGINSSKYYHVERNSKLPFLEGFYYAVAKDNVLESIPVIAGLSSISLPIWILLLCLLAPIARGRTRWSLPAMLSLLFWLTYLLGPVSNIRYVFPIMCAYPLLIACACFLSDGNAGQSAAAVENRPE